MLEPYDAPAYAEGRISGLVGLSPSDPRRLGAEPAAALRAQLSQIERYADQVASLGLPLSLNHNDLHQNNVFSVDDRLRFFDFGDALLTQPLAVLLVPLQMLGRALGAGHADRRLRRVADAALEVWSDLAPASELRAALPAALELGRLVRVECWLRCSVSAMDADLAEWGEAAPGWLKTLLPYFGYVIDFADQ